MPLQNLLSHALAQKNDILDPVCQTNLALLHRVFRVSACVLFWYEEQIGRKTTYVFPKIEQSSSSLLNLCQQIVEQNRATLSQGKQVIWQDNHELNQPPIRAIAEAFSVVSMIVSPIFCRYQYQGEIILLDADYRQWGNQDLLLLSDLVNNLGMNISDIYSHKYVENAPNNNDLIIKINQVINSPLDPEAVLVELLKLVAQTYPKSQIILLKINQDKIVIREAWQEHSSLDYLVGRHLSVSHCQQLLEKSLLNTELFIDDSFIDLQSESLEKGTLIYAPIAIKGKSFGGLILQNRYPIMSSPIDLNVVKGISEQIGIVLSQIQSQNQWIVNQLNLLNQEKENLEIAKQKTSEFLAYMTHEIRAPMAGIVGFARMLQEQIYGELNPKQSQYINLIMGSGEHLLSLINDYLDLSKLEANREELIVELISVEEMCLAALALVQCKAEEKQISLNLEINPSIQTFRGDQRRIKQILVNLLSNAIKFTDKGSVTLKVQSNQKTLELAVIDTGIGINADDQKQLFQPFQQIKSFSTNQEKGTGLGLTISRKLAQLHGGDITLTSEVGKGSCFRLHLPIDRD